MKLNIVITEFFYYESGVMVSTLQIRREDLNMTEITATVYL